MGRIVLLWLLGCCLLGVAIAKTIMIQEGPAISLDEIRGDSYVTSHSVKHVLKDSERFLEDDDQEIKEWHFHVYWFHTDPESYNRAMHLREKLIQAVKEKQFVVVFNGITSDIVPGVNESAIPLINQGPIGPHPSGSFEVWTPKESIAAALSWFMINRGELSILLHPLSRHIVEDHSGRATFFGTPWTINLQVLPFYVDEVPLEYPELKLGYSAELSDQQVQHFYSHHNVAERVE
eukprot:TRINITY_DN1252_c0_g1_i1.p1 TRINITY_DN1252_c0_g1~~TRINITY_DN1252_c0_g1_i1.p1  ORF type:complete len:235 (-),score=79.93 TRINITY_DN1252_c0_g1_i1:44-748(-)